MSEKKKYKITIEVMDIKGFCPIYKKGDQMVVEGSALNLKETDALCLKAVESWNGMTLVYAKGDDEAVKEWEAGEGWGITLRCPEPGEPYAPHGVVFFRVKRVPK